MADKILMTFPENGDSPRPETGPCRADDDWTGVFIRGDNSFCYASALRNVLASLGPSQGNFFDVEALHALLELLESSHEHRKE